MGKKTKEGKKVRKFEYNPLISILIPVYNISEKLLSECINSILKQSYKNFEICLADDASTNIETINTLKKYEKKDSRIKVVYRKNNGHISEATNSALNIAKGDFCALVDNDDVLTKNALYEMVLALNNNPKLDFIYSDEDKLDLDGKRCMPHFKPDFSPDTLLSINYICHFTLIRTNLIKKVGGFEKGLEGAQDHDLFLIVTELTNNIFHIPKILYHWRMVEGSTSMDSSEKSYAACKGELSINNALKRRNIKGKAKKTKLANHFIIKYDNYDKPLVSIIIDTKDNSINLDNCLQSIYKYTNYKNFEIIIINNKNKNKKIINLFNYYSSKYNNIKIINVNKKYNYSHNNNIGILKSKGDFICLINSRILVNSPNWINDMVSYAKQSHIGAVGVKLVYNNLIKNAGIFINKKNIINTALYCNKNDPGVYGRLLVPYNYSAVSGNCLMIEKKKLKEVNGFDEMFKIAFSDIDLNLKLLNKNYYNILLPHINLSITPDNTVNDDLIKKDQEYMYKKWKINEKLDPFYNKNFSLDKEFMLDE